MTVHELRHFFMGLSRDRARVRLVITANYDAGRCGIAFWKRPR